MTGSSNPPENLVIYEVEGAWDGNERPDLGPGFLGFWVEGGYTFFFFDRESGPEMTRLLDDGARFHLRYVHRMKYAQWQDGARFQPFTVGPLTIAPAWGGESVPDDRRVLIDPGLAFGFGGHPTTRACLKALVRIYGEDRPESVLDLGTGTGVLALAAMRLGAGRVRAVEYSHIAADTARRNVALNGLVGAVEVIRGQAEDWCGYPADLVCSNLHGPVQDEVLKRSGFDGRRWIVLSGLFHEQGRKLEASLTGSGYRTVDRVRDERWVTIVLKGGE